MNKITAIYVRRSVSDSDKGNNSLSIIAQKEECIKYATEHYKNDEYIVFCDDGKSGKDIEHRPSFQHMMSKVKEGEIARIIVKKYDRFSRNMREYLNITDELDKYGVGVISLSELFNTETKEGRMMRNNLLNFAEFERETIAARVKDAYSTKAHETGFYQGGKQYFGYQSSRQTINGKTGSVLVPSPQAYAVKKAYEIYKDPSAGLTDVIRFFQANDVDTYLPHKDGTISNMDRSQVSRILASPLYVRADKDVYNFLAAQGYEMLDDVSAYDGIHGLLWHKQKSEDRFIKVGYHEGLVDADIWLAVQDKKAHTHKFKGKNKVMASWLSGLIKCAHCGYSLTVTYRHNAAKTKTWRYLRDTGYFKRLGCIKSDLCIRPDDIEAAVFEAMKKRLSTLEIAKKESSKPNPEIERLEEAIIRADTEIRNLLDKVALANDTLMKHINDRIEALDSEKAELEQKLNKLKRKHKAIDTEPLAEPLERWDELTVQEKRNIAGKIIDVIRVSDDTGIDITFSI